MKEELLYALLFLLLLKLIPLFDAKLLFLLTEKCFRLYKTDEHVGFQTTGSECIKDGGFSGANQRPEFLKLHQ